MQSKKQIILDCHVIIKHHSFSHQNMHVKLKKRERKYFFIYKMLTSFRFIYWFLWTSKITLEWIFSNTFLENAFRYVYVWRSFKSFFYRTKGVSWLKQILLTFFAAKCSFYYSCICIILYFISVRLHSYKVLPFLH